MKKYRLIMMLLLASITIGIFVIVPAVREAGAAGAPQVVSKTPADGTVIPDAWEGVVEITYDTPVQFGSGLIMLYWRVKDRDDQIIWWERVEGEESEKYFSLSPDGKTVTVDFDWGGDPILRGDKYNTDMNEYKRRYWIKVEPGAIVSRDDPPVSAAYWGDHNWNVYVQATPPQIESRYPADRQTRVIAPAGTEFSVTFNENVLKWQPGAPVIYTYDYNNPYPSGSWDNELAVVCNDTRVTGNVLKFYLPKDLEANTTYGIMIPGPRNITGLNCDYIVDYPPSITPFPGLDYPEFYYELPQSGFWHFTTAQNYYAPYLEKKTPPGGAVEVSPDGDIMMEFDHMVESNTESSKYVCIKKHSDDSVVRQILNTVLLPAEEGRRELTIKNPGLSMNTKYYITIDSEAFVSSNNGLAYAGISDKSWSFTTTLETFKVRFFNGSAQIGETQLIKYGEDAVLPAAPEREGYVFAGWDKSYENVMQNLDIYAVFKEICKLSYSAGEHGAITGNADQEVIEGENGTPVTAVPDTGYHFVRWSDGVETAERTDTSVTGDLSVRAEFAINVYTLAYAADAHGRLTGDTLQKVEHGSNGTPVTALPDTGYHFVQWSDGVKTAEREDTNVTGDLSVIAEFAINVYTLTYTAGAHGKLTGVTSQQVEHGSSGTVVTAVPDLGYHFVKWSDGVTAAERTDANVTKDISVTAVFAINVYTLTYTAGAHGKLTGDALQKVEYGGSGTPVTAVPDLGYHFVQWSDGVKRWSGRTPT